MTMPDTERIESTPELENTAACPCGSGKSYEECCAPYHEEKCWPQDTLTMLRTRYCAYAVGAWDYLEKTAWQSEDEEPVTAEMLKERSEGIDWLGLSILQSGRDEEEGCDYVDYIAAYVVDGVAREIGEHAYFKTVEDKLYYTGGVPLVREPVRREAPKVGRNDPCPCGSGKKYKKCCGKNA